MTYPRNAASPPPFVVGQVVQISDGAVQTAGVAARVKTGAGSWVASSGSLNVDATSGFWDYAPTQAETNADTFSVVIYKTGCIGDGRTVPTSASASAGYVGTDQSKIANPTAIVNLTNTTIKAVTDGVTVSDKTGFSLASNGLAQVTAWTVAITGNITGNVTGSVGSISGVTFPSNFASLSIDANGKVLLQPTQTGVTIPIVTVVQELGSGALAANDLYTPIAQNVWNQLTTATWLANSFGKTVLVSGSTNRVIKVTGSGSGHVAADIHESQANSIHETAFDTSALSARVLATDAVGEIADGVWDEATSGHTTAGTTGKALIDSGAAGNPWTTDLATGYSGTQAGNILNEIKTASDLIDNIGINVYPVSASTPERVNGTTITVYKDEQTNVTISTTATLTGLTLRFVAENRAGEDVLVVENAGFAARTATSATLQIPSTLTDEIAVYNWTLRDITTGNSVLARGVLSVQAAASKDA